MAARRRCAFSAASQGPCGDHTVSLRPLHVIWSHKIVRLSRGRRNICDSCIGKRRLRNDDYSIPKMFTLFKVCCVLLWFGTDQFHRYLSELLHWHWRIWITCKPWELWANDTKPCDILRDTFYIALLLTKMLSLGRYNASSAHRNEIFSDLQW